MNKYLNKNEIGLDEAGRGPLIGRVYAGAVIWPENLEIPNFINDSKKLTPKKRKIALEWIKKNIPYWGVGYACNLEIDSINILEATRNAMERAINDLKTKTINSNININSLIIDGINWSKKFPGYDVTSVVKGDSTYASIAAASIIAKEYHDEHIDILCNEHPELNERYNLLKNKGYGTAKHIEGIKAHGYSEWHRKTFKLKKIG